MYQSHGKGRETPSIQALEETLRQVMVAFDDVYIMVNSLDECGDRIELLQWIQTVARSNSEKWHILVTSRSEPDITSYLELIDNIYRIRLHGSVLDIDISIFLDHRLSLISHWSEEIRNMVKRTLMSGADGM